jgi:hypothetical protein
LPEQQDEATTTVNVISASVSFALQATQFPNALAEQ